MYLSMIPTPTVLNAVLMLGGSWPPRRQVEDESDPPIRKHIIVD